MRISQSFQYVTTIDPRCHSTKGRFEQIFHQLDRYASLNVAFYFYIHRGSLCTVLLLTRARMCFGVTLTQKVVVTNPSSLPSLFFPLPFFCPCLPLPTLNEFHIGLLYPPLYVYSP